MVAKPHALAIAAALTAIAIAAASIPAVAKDQQTPGYQACFELSVERVPGPPKEATPERSRNIKILWSNAWREKSLSSTAQASLPRPVPANAYASTVTSKRTNRHPGPAR